LTRKKAGGGYVNTYGRGANYVNDFFYLHDGSTLLQITGRCIYKLFYSLCKIQKNESQFLALLIKIRVDQMPKKRVRLDDGITAKTLIKVFLYFIQPTTLSYVLLLLIIRK
jgi:hypothetical protein